MGSIWLPGPVLVVGPCVLESDEINALVAERVKALSVSLGIRVLFKASFDKANRTRLAAARGPGIERGLEMLQRVREEYELPVMTDVHEVWQVQRAADAVDALQIPAFLCRQTDLLRAAGQSGLPVNVKKGQWAAPEVMRGAVEKIRGDGPADIALTERGTFFGYGDLVVDMRSFRSMRQHGGVAVLFDATHSVQQPGRGANGRTGGVRESVPDLVCAAAAAGADGFFIETHPEPGTSPSDAATIWPLGDLEGLVERAVRVWHAARNHRVAV
jgi:2-dehydro-3-deoxyphosphooctonate aldolase (KDO 8-P synthase)